MVNRTVARLVAVGCSLAIAFLVAFSAAAQLVSTTVTFESEKFRALPDFGNGFGQFVVVTTPEGALAFFENCRLLTNSPLVPGNKTTVIGSQAGLRFGAGITFGTPAVAGLQFTLINAGPSDEFTVGYYDAQSVWHVFHTSVVPSNTSVVIGLPDGAASGIVYPRFTNSGADGFRYFIDDVKFKFGKAIAGLQLKAQLQTPSAAAETKALDGSAVTARIPLGARFTLALQAPGSTGATAVLAQYDLGSANLDEPTAPPEMFPDTALLEFDAAAAADEKVFQAVHLGEQTVTITPADGTTPAQTITVKVVKPAKLGTTNNTISDSSGTYNLDDQIVKWANRRGVPPHIVKGVINKETLPAFNPKTWRYEPLVTDWDNFAPAPYGKDDRTLAKFAPYVMEFSTTPRGSDLVDNEDVRPRSIFWLNKAAGVKIGDADQNVSAYTIVSQNESTQNWIKILKNKKKHQLLVPALIQTTLAWEAQTTLATSYGLMQILFPDSLVYDYNGVNGSRRPYYLFDVPGNVAGGGGSIQVGSAHLVKKYALAHGYKGKTISIAPTFATPAAFDYSMQVMMSYYNGSGSKNAPVSKYGTDAFAFSKKFFPVPATAIF